MPATLSTYDPELVRWGLHYLDGGFFSTENEDRSINNNVYSPEALGTPETPETPGTPERHVVGTHESPLINLPPVEVQHNSVAEDEAIAVALQAEFTRQAEEEARAARQNTGETTNNSTQTTRLRQEDWQDHRPFEASGGDATQYAGGEWEEEYYETQRQRGVNADLQYLSGENESEMGPRKYGSSSRPATKTSSSSPDYDSYQHGDDDENLNIALALSEDEYRSHEEVAKRLTKLDTIKHVPRINAEVIPTVDDASADHARLMERLVLYRLTERAVQGDGNCQFRALSDQLYHSTEHHKFVRKEIVTQLKARPDVYSGYVPLAYDEYLKKMARSGEWGDHVTLQAAADSYGVKINLLTSFKDTYFIEILPENLKSNRVLCLSFWAEVHYNSIFPEGYAPANYALAPKKKHWLLKSIF